ncbi:hypothetical protein PCANC_26750 [Puccinia coronata f. sp. avenae]|uniref:Uncharacterized protein n=1 Tax=Puccinia coronata f. sp. avenae TaxID=200324 RepID=A0A2N5TWE5_9BASI|nr:hypothetical protein PCANC_26750 [Puccinia coronata f. sp. avenae]
MRKPRPSCNPLQIYTPPLAEPGMTPQWEQNPGPNPPPQWPSRKPSQPPKTPPPATTKQAMVGKPSKGAGKGGRKFIDGVIPSHGYCGLPAFYDNS